MTPNEVQAQNTHVLANATFLVAAVVSEFAGNDVANSINGTSASTEAIQTLAAQRIIQRVTAPPQR